MPSASLDLDENERMQSFETPLVIESRLDISRHAPVLTHEDAETVYAEDTVSEARSSLLQGSSPSSFQRMMQKVGVAKNKKVTKSVGQVVEIEDAQRPLPMQAFEISDEFKKSMAHVCNYHYTRSARRSLLLELGRQASAGPRKEEKQLIADVIDPYTKANDKTCVYNYMGVIVSFGVLSLPKVLALCGLVPGILAIIAFGGLNSFWAHRLIELPMLVKSNPERYGDIAKACFPTFYSFAFISLIGTWYGSALLCYYCTLYYSRHHVVKKYSPALGYSMEVGFCLIYLFMSFRSSVKENQKRCILGMQMMYGILALVTLCSICHAVANYHENTYNLFGDSWDQILDGMLQIGMAYTGLGILPYVVSEMLTPEHARKVADKAILKITAYYVVFAFVGFIGWGKNAPSSIARGIERLGEEHIFYRVVGLIITLLLMGKFLLIYPILFLPLLRELEGFLQLEETPPIMLGLPWAIRRLHHTKVVLRIIVAFSAFVVYQFCNDFFLVSAFCLIPFFLTQMILPSVLTLKAMAIWHERESFTRSITRSVQQGISKKLNSKDRMFGIKMWQVLVTGFLAIISMSLGSIAIMESLNNMVEERAQKGHSKKMSAE